MAKKVQLGGKVTPSLEDFSKVGFIIGTFKNNKFPATLPEGWTSIKSTGHHGSETVIFDEKNRARANIFIVKAKSQVYASSESRLYRRYSIQCINHHDADPQGNYEIALYKIEPSFENQSKKDPHDVLVISAGRTRVAPQYDTATNTYSDTHPAVRICKEYADLNFPDWLDPTAYWD